MLICKELPALEDKKIKTATEKRARIGTINREKRDGPYALKKMLNPAQKRNAN